MAKKNIKNYYAIKEGRKSNLIVESWKECAELTQGCKSVFKGFKTKEEAEEYLNIKETKLKENKIQINQSCKGKISYKSKNAHKRVSTVLDNDTYIKFANKCNELESNEEKIISNLIKEWLGLI